MFFFTKKELKVSITNKIILNVKIILSNPSFQMGGHLNLAIKK